MLTVWCVWWRDPANPDKYSAYHVQRLKRTVAENLSIPHRFRCLTDERVDGVDTVAPWSGWPGWWGKLELFELCDGPYLYLDLDVVVTGSLDGIVESLDQHNLAMPLNWAQSGHGGCQSSVMVWRDCDMTRQIYDLFDPAIAYWPPRNDGGKLWGDQEWITTLRDDGLIRVRPLPEPWIKSYKYHVRGQGLPDDCRVVVFHGEPKPEAVRESWFQW
jgi:hypothetical protein